MFVCATIFERQAHSGLHWELNVSISYGFRKDKVPCSTWVDPRSSNPPGEIHGAAILAQSACDASSIPRFLRLSLYGDLSSWISSLTITQAVVQFNALSDDNLVMDTVSGLPGARDAAAG